MESNEVLEKIQPIFQDIFDDEDLVVTRETCAADVEDWDSFAQMQIVMALEDMFKIKFRTSEIETWKNVGNVVDAIISHLNR
ncbi:acyl carrier protein [Candidatus Weimeria sp. HCP3S3_B5]|uniref:acyl carrier protein n=1 Tax=Candidatus Weimeria sp. HCP3S3_B5 TaxID=3438871 RepID=UPI003F8C7C44